MKPVFRSLAGWHSADRALCGLLLLLFQELATKREAAATCINADIKLAHESAVCTSGKHNCQKRECTNPRIRVKIEQYRLGLRWFVAHFSPGSMQVPCKP